MGQRIDKNLPTKESSYEEHRTKNVVCPSSDKCHCGCRLRFGANADGVSRRIAPRVMTAQLNPKPRSVDAHLHFRPFGGHALPFEEVVSYLEKTGVRFVNIYGIGQMLPVSSTCTYYLGLSGHAGDTHAEERFRQCRQLCAEDSAGHPHDAFDDVPGPVRNRRPSFPACNSWKENIRACSSGWAKSTW